MAFGLLPLRPEIGIVFEHLGAVWNHGGVCSYQFLLHVNVAGLFGDTAAGLDISYGVQAKRIVRDPEFVIVVCCC